MVEWVNLFSDKQNYVHCCEPSAKVPMLLDRGTPQFLRVRRKRTTAVGECGGNPRNRGINWIIMLGDSKGREKDGREMDRKVFWGSLTIECHQAYNNSRRDGGRLKYVFWLRHVKYYFQCYACESTPVLLARQLFVLLMLLFVFTVSACAYHVSTPPFHGVSKGCQIQLIACLAGHCNAVDRLNHVVVTK